MTAATISTAHADYLTGSAIDLAVAVAGGVRTANALEELPAALRWCGSTPGIVFPYRSPAGAVVEQYRPDVPVDMGEGRSAKYVFPKDSTAGLNVHPDMADRLSSAGRIVVVEGTKQHLAAVTAAADLDVAVVGMAGCYGWSSGGEPSPDLALIPWSGREVVVVFDADLATNIDVYTAASRLADELDLRGAGSVKFVSLPGGGKSGLDDVLASRAGDGPTSVVFARLVDKAGKLPRKPSPKKNKFFGADGLMVEKLVDAIGAEHHLAVDPGERILVYRDGVYIDGRHAVNAAIGDMLGDAYRPLHARAAVELLVSRLHEAGRTIGDTPSTALVNLANGLLNPFTGDLAPHTHEHLSLVQFPVAWNPKAECTVFDGWLDEVTGGRGDDLLEASAQVLDLRGHRQRKAVFAHGPTRSGKSTYLRLMENIVGHDARSAVTLHDLTGNRFACADLFGKVLNTANELSSAHVDDLATFKSVTGDDPIRAERKYGQPFTFRNRALFMFAANEIPTVSEVSGAYLARIRPYRFPNSYEGRENPDLEARMLRELPGILVRLVEALRRFDTRGGYLDDDDSQGALDDFARHSDRVRLFLHETTTRATDAHVERGELFEAFERWAQQNRRQVLGRHRFYDHISTAGYRAVVRRGKRGFVGLELRHEHEWGAPDGPDDDEGVQKVQNIHTPASREAEEGEEKTPLVRGGLAGAAPSAPPLDLEVVEW
jgi:putative DNA primase/helicase